MKPALRHVLKLFLSALIIGFLEGMFVKVQQDSINSQVTAVQKDKPSYRAFPLYASVVLEILGFYYFIVLQKRSTAEAAFFGFLIYGIFALVNYGMFSHWSLTWTIKEIIWGPVLFGTAAALLKMV